MTEPSMNNSSRTVKIALANGRLFVDGGYHPHFQDAIKDRLAAVFHKEKKIWHVSAERSAELDECIQEFFPSAEIVDYRNNKEAPAVKPRTPAREPNIIDKLSKAGHICNLKGKQYILFSGLLQLAHENGIESIDTEVITVDAIEQSAVIVARVKGDRGSFSGHGDASPLNVSKMMAPSFLRMAETRAVARALRFYLGIGMCAREELPS